MPTLRERLEYRVARGLLLLPAKQQVRLSGQPPIHLDGQTLEPELQMLLGLMERQGAPAMESLGVAEARAQLKAQALSTAGKEIAVAAVRDLRVDGAVGPLPARHYRTPEPGGPHPLLVYLHGGGFATGDIDTHDALCRLLCVHAGVDVVSVDYRLGPEDPFPAAAQDAIAVLAWAHREAAALGADPQRILIGGDSAGGNLAAVASLHAATNDLPGPHLQLLLYPAVDMVGEFASRDLFAEGFFLTRPLMEWFMAQYIGPDQGYDPLLSPLGAESLAGVAPALVITAGFDPLRDEGEAYAEKLRADGVPVVLRRFPGLIHGFCSMTGVSHACRDATLEIAGALRALSRSL